MKKTKSYQTKRCIKITALENHFQIIQTIQEINHLITQAIEADHQNELIHEMSHKIDIVDQIVKTISIEITIHDRIPTEENFHLIPVPIQTLGIDTIPTIDHEIHQTIETETILAKELEAIQVIEINIIQTTDQEITHTIDQINRDLMIMI